MSQPTQRYSQYGQDSLVGDVLFKGRSGVFVDVGARDGITISNTYYLEKHLSWTGIAIEPHPELFELLTQRRLCKCVNIAVSNKSEEHAAFVKLLEGPVGNSGLWTSFRHKKWLEQVKHEIIQVQCQSLSSLITELDTIDYLDIDVEGHEYQVLEGIDFDQIEIKVVGVEVDEDTSASQKMDALMKSRGFLPFAQLCSDRFYSYKSSIPSARKLF